MNDRPPGQRFLPAYRLRRQSDFERVYARRNRAGDDLLLVYAAENGLEHPRLGLSVSRRVGGAVVRNRWKRLLREAFRLQIAELPRGLDLVVVPRGGTEPQLGPLKESLRHLAVRLASRLKKDRTHPTRERGSVSPKREPGHTNPKREPGHTNPKREPGHTNPKRERGSQNDGSGP